jgi:hypothetical protein
MKFNINENVKVKLTNFGISVLRKQHDELMKVYSKVMDFPKFQEPEKDENGYSKFQLWALMESLGSYCGMAKEPPFETEIILSTGETESEQSVRVLIANENEKVKECIVIHSEEVELENKLRSALIDIYGGRNVCSAPRKIGYIPESILHIVTEPEVMEVLGMKPKKYLDNSNMITKYYYAIITDDMYISGANLPDEKAALESWNKLATKMKGE